MVESVFRKAEENETQQIWEILQSAIDRRKEDGSSQWQNGYPNVKTVEEDILQGKGYVLAQGSILIAYCAISISDEVAYNNIDGAWLTDGDYLVIHRVAVSSLHIKKGFAKEIIRRSEKFAKENGIMSVRIDTNFDNFPMLKICEQLQYQYCGMVKMRESDRKAFEKIL